VLFIGHKFPTTYIRSIKDSKDADFRLVDFEFHSQNSDDALWSKPKKRFEKLAGKLERNFLMFWKIAIQSLSENKKLHIILKMFKC